jgi:hypothetical protein
MHGVERYKPQLPSVSTFNLNFLRYDGVKNDFTIRWDPSSGIREFLQPLTQVLEAVDTGLMVVLCVSIPCSNIVVDFERFRRGGVRRDRVEK